MELASHYLETVIATLKSQKQLAERALAQLEEDDFHVTLDPESNSIAVIIKHMAGNMRSRWTDFLSTDGEKPDRHRDDEFIDDKESVEALMTRWEAGWQTLFDTLEHLSTDDLLKTITIRGQEQTALQATQRQLAHYGNHVGQMLFLAKHFKSADWQTLSIARGQSDAYKPKVS